MSERLLDPIQLDVTNSLSVLATVPTDKEWAFSVLICNRDNATRTFRLSIAPAGASDDPSQYLAYDESLAAGQRTEFRGLTGREATEIRVKADTTLKLSASIVGVERDE